MYCDYWQLEKKPFEFCVDRESFYPGESQQGALLKIRYAIESRRSAALVAGPSGSGKTMLVQMLANDLGENYLTFVQVVFPQMTNRDLLTYIAHKLGAPEVENPQYSTVEGLLRIENRLVENAKAGQHAVLVIDEAHLLEDSFAFETLRLLQNIEYQSLPTMTLLLVGQTALLPITDRNQSLEERLAVKAILAPLSLEETSCYLQHRLRVAGAKREIFNQHAVEALHILTQGNPRQINRLADLALLVGYAEGLEIITVEHLEAVSGELLLVV